MKPRRPLGSHRNYDPLSELIFTRSEGEFVWDDRGNKYLDLICGYSACNLGHAHPSITAAACQQLTSLTWAHGGESHERLRLEESLATLWDSKSIEDSQSTRHTKVWLTLSGARAIEIAWKLAYAKHPGTAIGFDLAYHGRSLATAYLSDTQRSEAIGPSVMPRGATTIPFPRHPKGVCGPILVKPENRHENRHATAKACTEKACNGGTKQAELCAECLASLDQAQRVFDRSHSHGSILFIEPAIGARGYYFAPAAYMQRLVELARNHGFAIICDEIQMGLRRTGPMFMCQAQGWEPDLLVLGKSLGGGIVPIAAVLGSHEWIDAIPPGIESETFAAYPLACRIAQETLEILEQGNLAGEIERKGELFRTLLRTSLPQNIVIHGVGLASCVSLENLPNQGVSAAVDLVRRLAKQGVLVHLTGPKRNRIATIPSLLIGQASIELAAKEIIKAFEAVG